MVSLKLQKRLASSVLKCVRHRSWNNSPREASSCITEGVEFIVRSYPNPSTSPRHRTPSILPKTISPWATLPKKIEAYDPDPKERFTAAMQQRLQIFGPNKLEEKEKSKFLGFMWNPLSWVMEAAAIMAIALANGGRKPSDWQDFVGITALLVINSTIRFIEENNAGNAAASLMARLVPKAKILRDGRWTEEDVAILVPGDVISIKLGDIIPADAPLLEWDLSRLIRSFPRKKKIDQSALTGESLPATKGPGDGVYSGSTVKQGEIETVVIATGVHTFFGKATHLVDSTNQVGHFQFYITHELFTLNLNIPFLLYDIECY